MQNYTSEEFLASQGISKTFPQRFWAKVKKTETCWIWTGCKCNMGYGSIGKGMRGAGMIKAHRAAWIMSHGPIPYGLFCLHKCDDPSCVSVEHLFLGTKKDNTQDAIEKGRMAKGESHGMAKLTKKDVIDILAMLKNGIYGKSLARMYHVTKQEISNINTGKTWRHVTGI